MTEKQYNQLLELRKNEYYKKSEPSKREFNISKYSEDINDIVSILDKRKNTSRSDNSDLDSEKKEMLLMALESSQYKEDVIKVFDKYMYELSDFYNDTNIPMEILKHFVPIRYFDLLFLSMRRNKEIVALDPIVREHVPGCGSKTILVSAHFIHTSMSGSHIENRFGDILFDDDRDRTVFLVIQNSFRRFSDKFKIDHSPHILDLDFLYHAEIVQYHLVDTMALNKVPDELRYYTLKIQQTLYNVNSYNNEDGIDKGEYLPLIHILDTGRFIPTISMKGLLYPKTEDLLSSFQNDCIGYDIEKYLPYAQTTSDILKYFIKRYEKTAVIDPSCAVLPTRFVELVYLNRIYPDLSLVAVIPVENDELIFVTIDRGKMKFISNADIYMDYDKILGYMADMCYIINLPFVKK